MSRARVAAPLAFLLAATIAILLIRSALNAEEPAAEPVITATVETETETTETETTTGTGETTAGDLYVVQSGDTLESIAVEHDTTVEELLTLNPGIDPVALSIGQQIRVG
ncbi:MAG: LysM domain-containing protein [Gaiellaceae bacterium]